MTEADKMTYLMKGEIEKILLGIPKNLLIATDNRAKKMNVTRTWYIRMAIFRAINQDKLIEEEYERTNKKGIENN